MQLKNLRRGEKVWALIEEVLELQEVLVNFSGDLIRVANETRRLFRPGQRVLLEVQGIKPLKFKLVTRSFQSSGSSRSLDVSI